VDRLEIKGGKPLSGEISISGAKNSALPILTASLLTKDSIFLKNVPRLNDVSTTVNLLRTMGVEITFHDGITIEINSSKATRPFAAYDLVKTMRASILVLGPLLGKFGFAEVSLPGGCAIGARPVNLHVESLKKMGANIEISGGYIKATAKKLKGAEIIFDTPSVTATENIIMAATLAEGETIIKNAAQEPEIEDLIIFLKKMGARIEGACSDTIKIKGVKELKGANHLILSDRIEAGTYLVAAAITGGHLRLNKISPKNLSSVLLKLEESGAFIVTSSDYVEIDMRGKRPKATNIFTGPYPGFPTDMQAQFCALNAIADGVSEITETVFENRFMHTQELQRMGANLNIDGRKVTISGADSLNGANVMATDLRASASLVLAALAAKGRTIVDRIYHIDRGYESIEEKLSQVGADIKRLHP
tara:strand:- start:91525 stop:92784 length:1260 start_codon:yes stop_codon:yes gene_type:complete